MTDLGLNNALKTNANVESEHADAGANAASEGALQASPEGVSYVGSAQADATASAHDATASLDGSLGGGLDAGPDGASAGVEGMLDGMLDVMGSLVAQFSGSLTALLGF